MIRMTGFLLDVPRLTPASLNYLAGRRERRRAGKVDRKRKTNEPSVREPWFRPAYNPPMARGWESKSVEAQQADAVDKRTEQRPRLTPEEAARQREIEGLRLSSRRTAEQIASSLDPRRRKMLEDALADLETKIGKLGG
jgi:hypothetical protein